jgi:hypothetical protein
MALLGGGCHMHMIVQEGEASISLVFPIQAPDENLRTSTLSSVVGRVKIYYRDFELVLIEARDGALEIMPAAVGAITWLSKDRRYQLKPGA